MQEGQEPGKLIVPQAPSSEISPPTLATAVTPPPAAPTPQPPIASEVPTPAPMSTPLPQQPVTPAPAQPSGVIAAAAPQPSEDWRYTHDDTAPALAESVSWTASQFIAHDKGFGWYAALALGGVVATTLVYLLTKDKITSGIIIFALLTFGVYAGRQPRDEQYSLNSQGIQIGGKFYVFHDFKSFSVVDESNAVSIVLMPLKRFMPALTVYVTDDVEEQVVDYLSAFLPFSEHKADALEGLLRRIRF